MKKEEKNIISEELAIQELTAFYNNHSLIEKEENEVKDELNIALIALKNGLLKFNSNYEPVYTLKTPLLNDNGDVTMSEISFKTRIFPKDHIALSKGLNVQRDSMEYMQKCIAHLANLATPAYLNKFSKFDYTVIQQISTVFM